MSDIKRIAADRLEVGMYVASQSQGVAGEGLLEKGFIQRQQTLDKLRLKSTADVFIDVSKGKDSIFAVPLSNNRNPSAYAVKPEQERMRAERVYGEARNLMSDVLQDVKMGKAIDVTPMASLAEDINTSVLTNANALLCLSQIRAKDKYLLEHSINVAILMSVFATYLDYPKAVVQELTLGALLHDIGKINVPAAILNKPGKLSGDEWAEMKRHVVYGEAVLFNSDGMSEIAKSICSLHHERLDGTGYPLGLQASDISAYGRMGAIVDVYDALTATRCYHRGLSPAKVMKMLLDMGDRHMDRDLVYSFVRCMGIYPVGALLEMQNGRLGVVIEVRNEKPDKPLVRLFYQNKYKRYESIEVVDLAKSNLKVAKTWHPDDLSINVNDFL